MDKYAKLHETFKAAFGQKMMMPLMVGVVKEITGDTCTVAFDGIEITDVRLKIDKGGEDDRLIQFPTVGKMVLCGSLTGDFKDLVVIKSERVAKVQYDENGLSIEIDSESGKVRVSNESVSLKDLFDDLKSIIENLKVFTPAGPSGNPLPGTIISLNALQTKINQLLN